MSFVRAIQLGGKGYAPPDSHPLRGHLKGLSDFVRFTDHLQELMGGTPDPRYYLLNLVFSCWTCPSPPSRLPIGCHFFWLSITRHI